MAEEEEADCAESNRTILLTKVLVQLVAVPLSMLHFPLSRQVISHFQAVKDVVRLSLGESQNTSVRSPALPPPCRPASSSSN